MFQPVRTEPHAVVPIDSGRINFVLQKEKQKVDRKRIETQGVSDFQHIVTQGLSPQLLQAPTEQARRGKVAQASEPVWHPIRETLL